MSRNSCDDCYLGQDLEFGKYQENCTFCSTKYSEELAQKQIKCLRKKCDF